MICGNVSCYISVLLLQWLFYGSGGCVLCGTWLVAERLSVTAAARLFFVSRAVCLVLVHYQVSDWQSH